PSKYLYDDAGSALFERITQLPEYYPTRTELAILKDHAADIARLIGPDVELVEFGAGALRKVRILLDVLKSPRAYLPIDISGDYLMDVAASLGDDYPGLRLRPVVGDFTHAISLGALTPGAGRRAGFFPGSTIGNLGRSESVSFLRHARATLNGGGLLNGVDLERFSHYACYNPLQQRIEMYLISRAAQRVRIADEVAEFAEGEAIHTEDSRKYTLDGFGALAAEAGYAPLRVWTDPDRYFSVQWLEAI